MEQKLKPLPVKFYDKKYRVKLQAFQDNSQVCFDCFYYTQNGECTCLKGCCVWTAIQNDLTVLSVIFKEIEND